MKPRIHLITLAVDDLERSLAFYHDGLGLESEGLVGAEFQGDEMNPNGTIALFRLGGGMVLSISAQRACKGRPRTVWRGQERRIQHRARRRHQGGGR
jgi:catechol 2,3-dioxygenase-like lactoylglutathione lyase family enzyme